MVILVRCPDNTVTVALESKLETLIKDGLITAYLGADGWVAANRPTQKPRPATCSKPRCTGFANCF